MKGFWYGAAGVVFSAALLATGVVHGAAHKSASKSQHAANAEMAGQISGKVVETMDSGGYTYVLVQEGGQKTWVAVPAMKVKVGQSVSFSPGVEMKNFTSKTLNRTFDSIYFSTGPAGGAHNDGMVAAAPKKTAPVKGEKISVTKAQGKDAYTVSEIYAKKEALHEKPAVIRAKVVKVASGIMGKNWIHLQDGTGDAATGTNDLVATTQDTASVGDVVTVKGTVYKDKDFGAGYKYSVIMEKASVRK
jgi:hypothetical protein